MGEETTTSGRISGETVTAPKGQGFIGHKLSGKRTENIYRVSAWYKGQVSEGFDLFNI